MIPGASPPNGPTARPIPLGPPARRLPTRGPQNRLTTRAPRTWGMISHIGAIAGYTIILGGVLVPLMIYLARPHASRFVAEHLDDLVRAGPPKRACSGFSAPVAHAVRVRTGPGRRPRPWCTLRVLPGMRALSRRGRTKLPVALDSRCLLDGTRESRGADSISPVRGRPQETPVAEGEGTTRRAEKVGCRVT